MAIGREKPPTSHYLVRIYKGKAVIKTTTIRSRNDREAEIVAQKLMEWEGGDSFGYEKKDTA